MKRKAIALQAHCRFTYSAAAASQHKYTITSLRSFFSIRFLNSIFFLYIFFCRNMTQRTIIDTKHKHTFIYWRTNYAPRPHAVNSKNREWKRLAHTQANEWMNECQILHLKYYKTISYVRDVSSIKVKTTETHTVVALLYACNRCYLCLFVANGPVYHGITVIGVNWRIKTNMCMRCACIVF